MKKNAKSTAAPRSDGRGKQQTRADDSQNHGTRSVKITKDTPMRRYEVGLRNGKIHFLEGIYSCMMRQAGDRDLTKVLFFKDFEAHEERRPFAWFRDLDVSYLIAHEPRTVASGFILTPELAQMIQSRVSEYVGENITLSGMGSGFATFGTPMMGKGNPRQMEGNAPSGKEEQKVGVDFLREKK